MPADKLLCVVHQVAAHGHIDTGAHIVLIALRLIHPRGELP
jgi:hypothetical protein